MGKAIGPNFFKIRLMANASPLVKWEKVRRDTQSLH